MRGVWSNAGDATVCRSVDVLKMSVADVQYTNKNQYTMRLDEVKALAQRAHGDSACRDGLFAAMLGGTGKAATDAAWTLTHLPSADDVYIDMRRTPIVQLAMTTADTSLRRIALSLLARLEWADADVALLDFCLEHMALRDESYGVRALCMKLAYLQCRHYPELKAELRQALLLIEPDELGAGVRHSRGKILAML